MIFNQSPEFKEYVLNFKGSRTLIPLECPYCQQIFLTSKNEILGKLAKNNPTKYCSIRCKSNARITLITKPCSQCGTLVTRPPNQVKKGKTDNIFCNASCSASYNNTHKTTGVRRSKLEAWLEEKLPIIYPDLKFMFNDKSIINSELDIYIPALKLAFELNGIFHYEPIFGQDKLNQIQNNDNNKFQLCQQNNISLCVIDTSWIKNHKEANAQKILDIITKIINDII
jgi:hypothetical protein